LPKAINSAELKHKAQKNGQLTMFDGPIDGSGEGNQYAAESLPDIPEWPETEKLKYEKEALDFYMSSHPLAQFETELRRYVSHDVERARRLDQGAEVRIGGMISQVRFFTSKKSNKRYARCKIEDFSGTAECVMWPSDFERFTEMFVDDRIVLAQAVIDRPEHVDEPVFVLSKLLTLERARRELTTGMLLRMSLQTHGPEHVDALGRLLKRVPGPCRVELQVTDAGGRRARLKLADDLRVDPGKVAVEEMEMILGPGGIMFTGK
jgi:DNA polymerase III subunit alpha